MKTPINISKKLPKKYNIKSGSIKSKIFPKHKERDVILIDIIIKIKIAGSEIFVFLTPYVIPIPKESMLVDIASSIDEINIKPPLY